MSEVACDSVFRQWASLGAMFSVTPARSPIDLERLLLDTARHASSDAGLTMMSITWLTHYGEYIATHRLARLILDELKREHCPTLGMILDFAQAYRSDSRFGKAVEACGRAIDAKPLYEIQRENSLLKRLAEQNASPISKKWGRWVGEFELKNNALRPPEWVARHNPHLRYRALTGGDLVASILAEAQADNGQRTYESELDLAKAFVASRSAVREAIHKLKLAGMLESKRVGRSSVIKVLP